MFLRKKGLYDVIHSYTSMQRKRYVYPVQLDETVREALEKITEKLGCSKADAIRDAILSYAETIRGLEVVKIRNVSREQAKKEILEFLKERDRAYADEIADALQLDFGLVNELLAELWEEERVEPA